MAIYLVIGAIIVAAAGAVLQALAASNSTAERRGRRTATLAIFAGLLTAVWVILLWFAQQRYTQEWNSRPVVEFYIDKEKRLNLENRGLVEAMIAEPRHSESRVRAHSERCQEYDGPDRFEEDADPPEVLP